MTKRERAERANEKRERAVALRRQLLSQEAIADALGVTVGMVSVYLRRGLDPREHERITHEVRMRGHAHLRTAQRVKRTCEWCGEMFEVSSTQLRHRPARYCGDECRNAWLWDGPGAAERRTNAHVALKDVRAASAESRKKEGLLYVEELVALLPRRLQRERPSLLRHIARGGLVPDAQDSSGRRLYHESQVARYREWLENHPDSRGLRFSQDGDWADKWSQVHHGTKPGAVRGRYNAAKGEGKKTGRRRELADFEVTRIREMASRGKSQRTIAVAVGVSRRQVQRLLEKIEPPSSIPEGVKRAVDLVASK